LKNEVFMGKVLLDMSMSLDGFVAGPNNEDGGLHDYFFFPSGDIARVVEEGIKTTGAIIMGRRCYDLGDQLDGFANNPYKVPHFVLSHVVPEKSARGETPFVFVADGIENALTQAKAVAGDRNVVIGGGANTAQQFISAGLIDELHLYLFLWPLCPETNRTACPPHWTDPRPSANQIRSYHVLHRANGTHCRGPRTPLPAHRWTGRTRYRGSAATA
jgi:dihydrofolate reductase